MRSFSIDNGGCIGMEGRAHSNWARNQRDRISKIAKDINNGVLILFLILDFHNRKLPTTNRIGIVNGNNKIKIVITPVIEFMISIKLDYKESYCVYLEEVPSIYFLLP